MQEDKEKSVKSWDYFSKMIVYNNNKKKPLKYQQKTSSGYFMILEINEIFLLIFKWRNPMKRWHTLIFVCVTQCLKFEC